MKPKLLTVVLLALLWASSAYARIGETEAQIEARYGKSVMVLDENPPIVAKGYDFQDMFIVVEFEDGVSQSEGFSKKDHTDFSDNEITLLLEANKHGYNWLGHLDQVPAGARAWCSTDKKSRVAFYDGVKHRLIISSQPFLDRKEAQRKAKEREKLKKF